MKLLSYAGSEFLIGDDVAAAVMRYSEALAEEQTAASVEIPILADDGSPSRAIFLVGPASQIVATDAHVDYDEPVHPDVVARLDELTRALHPSAVTESHQPDAGAWDQDY